MHPIIFCFIFIVACVAAGVIYFNRRHVQATRVRHHEPVIGKPVVSSSAMRMEEDYADDEKDEELLYDPIVASKSTPQSQQRPAISSFVSQRASVKPLATNTPKSMPPTTQPHQSQTRIASTNSPAGRVQFTNDIISLMLKASNDRAYAGYELLQALLSVGLRYGKMNIFHRHEQSNLNSPVLFSLAAATEQGTFDMPKMGGFNCKGLILFLRVANQEDLGKTFELMLDTARQLIDDLGGEILLEQKQPLNEHNLSQLRQRIDEYERAGQTEDLFA